VSASTIYFEGQMLKSFGELLSRPWVGPAIAALSLFATLLALIERKRRRLSYSVGNLLVVSSQFAFAAEGLAITYNEEAIQDLIAIEVDIWNSGNLPFDETVIVKSDLPAIEVRGEGKIVAAHVSVLSRDGIGARVEGASLDRVSMVFDFLDPGDGFRINLLYSGLLDSSKRRGAVSLEGTIRGLPQGAYQSSHGKTSFVAGVYLLLLLPIAVTSLLFIPSLTVGYEPLNRGLLIVIAIVIVAMWVVQLRLLGGKRRYPRALRGSNLWARTERDYVGIMRR